MVARGLTPTRARARDLIQRGEVFVGGQVAVKPAQGVGPETDIAVSRSVAGDVSRGASKLRAGLDAFGYLPQGVVALDVGSSTGGFTQVLLERGATRVYSVDVGRDQLHASLLGDLRVVALQQTDVRELTEDAIPEQVGAVVCDVSFVSLRKVLGAGLALAADDAWLVALIKPQFEVGRENVGKGGIVRDEAARQRAVDDVCEFLRKAGFSVAGVIDSPISGGDGNVEFLVGARRKERI
jgi:23S rRNA (cytidine1920-2'-O)/16S rRNA (cytidine1409-2'-O)-methyltransferase